MEHFCIECQPYPLRYLQTWGVSDRWSTVFAFYLSSKPRAGEALHLIGIWVVNLFLAEKCHSCRRGTEIKMEHHLSFLHGHRLQLWLWQSSFLLLLLFHLYFPAPQSRLINTPCCPLYLNQPRFQMAKQWGIQLQMSGAPQSLKRLGEGGILLSHQQTELFACGLYQPLCLIKLNLQPVLLGAKCIDCYINQSFARPFSDYLPYIAWCIAGMWSGSMSPSSVREWGLHCKKIRTSTDDILNPVMWSHFKYCHFFIFSI